MTYEPDFSGDDFASDADIQRNRKEAAAYQKLINDSLDLIKAELRAEDSSHRNLKQFVMFKNLQATIVNTFASKNVSSELIVSVAEYSSSYPTAKNPNTGTDIYLFGRIGLKRKYPKTYICRETIREKISDLFLKTETDFAEHKKFSDKFHVLTENSESLTQLVRLKNLDELIIFPNMEVEIHEDYCLFRNSRRPVSLLEAAEYVQLTRVLLKIFQ